MSRSYWSIAVALGLIALACSGQAQESSSRAERQTQQEQTPAETLPLPFPVEIVEDEATADARQRSEEEARQRDIEDLRAQEGMNAATQAMNEATQRMADDSREIVAATWVGVVLLIVTLLLMWQANRAAVAAVEVTRRIGEAEVRAYMGLHPGKSFDENFKIEINKPPEVYLVFSNYGQTPAYNVGSTGFFAFSPELSGEFEKLIRARITELTSSDTGTIIAPGGEKRSRISDGIQPIHTEDFANFRSGDVNLYFFGYLFYEDVFGNTCRTYYGVSIPGGLDGGVWVEHLVGYNYRDDDCQK